MSPIGLRLGGILVRREVARGGMGVVYEGLQESLNRPVAIKVLYPHLSQDASFRERFQREAHAMASWRHNHIVRVIDFGSDHGYHYLVMELIDGRSLREELATLRDQGRWISEQRALSILEQVAAALTYAHQRGVIHRDVKPGNILIEADGSALLTDFGLVRLVDTSGLTSTGMLVGTPEYMAPEQHANTGDVGPATDQYALAVVAYELLVGQTPFQAPTPVSVLHKHLVEPPPRPQALKPGFPLAVEQVLLRALAKQPAERFPSTTDFVDDLRTAARPMLAGTSPISNQVTLAQPTPIPATKADSSRALPVGWIAAGVMALVLIGVLAVVLLAGDDDGDADAQQIAGGATPTSRQASGAERTTPATSTVTGVGAVLISPSPFVSPTPTPTDGSTATVAPTNTRLPASTVTPTPSPTANVAATQMVLDVTATRFAAELAAFDAIRAEIYPRTRIVHGPTSGELLHDAQSGAVSGIAAGVDLRDTWTEVRFSNPYAVEEGAWDYGLFFRRMADRTSFRLWVDSDRNWYLWLTVIENGQLTFTPAPLQSGRVEQLDVSPGGVNELTLVAVGDRAHFYVNDEYVAELLLDQKMDSGDVAVVTGINPGNEITGRSTRFDGFILRAIE